MRLAAPIAFALAMMASSTAFAHATLLRASPAAGSTVGKTGTILLDFSDDLVAAQSGIDLVMTAMPGMADHPPMPIKGIAAIAKGKTLSIALPRPLPAGTYQLTWHVAGADQHKVEGRYSFTVR